MSGSIKPGADDLLLVVDLQNDFCPGGALAVPDGDKIIGLVNEIAGGFKHVIMTQDWHPKNHLSFASSHPGKQPYDTVELSYGEQILWPDHCVQGSSGAEFHQDVDIPHCQLVTRKGFHREIDSYSGFVENDKATPTGLAGYLGERGFHRVFMAGLATDFCVQYTCLDAIKFGFNAVIIDDACRGIDIDGSLMAAYENMSKAGVKKIVSSDIAL
jgi:nicotinamidase/pyrazinamidase